MTNPKTKNHDRTAFKMKDNNAVALAYRGIITADMTVEKEFIKHSYGQLSYMSKTATIGRLVTFVMHCFTTTCSVECYWHCTKVV